MLRSPNDVPGWISPEYGGGGSTVIGGWWRVPPDDFDTIPGGGGISQPPPIDPTLNPDSTAITVTPTGGTATQNEAAESIDANFILIGAAVVLGVILLTTGKD